MNYIEAPDEFKGGGISVFIAGGITGCPDWQSEFVAMLKDDELTLLNPRRRHFPLNGQGAFEGQVRWEHEHLAKATAIAFWFPKEAVEPIALYELGAWSMTKKPLFVGVEEGYSRRFDVVEQTRLARPEIEVVYALPELAKRVSKWSSGMR